MEQRDRRRAEQNQKQWSGPEGDSVIRFKAGEDHSARPAPLENGNKSIKSPKIDLLYNCFVPL